MADKSKGSRKKPVSQKRVAVVLASLVGTLTLSAGTLLVLDNGGSAIGNIPGAVAVNEQPSLEKLVTPTAPLNPRAWDYIIIYESGDLAGSSASLSEGRVQGGVSGNLNSAQRPKANFHFVVGNAHSRRGAADGELEVGATWMKQQSGAVYAEWPNQRYHSKSDYYGNAVGICVTGVMNKESFSRNQNRTLVSLAKHLQDRLNIPANRVMFQWELEPNASNATAAQKEYAQAFRAQLR